MNVKKTMIVGSIFIIICVFFLVGYNIFRYPTLFRSLNDYSLNAEQTEQIKQEILSKEELTILVAYFSYSGTTQRVANEISEKTSGDLFEITPKTNYSNVYIESNMEIRNNARPELASEVENMDAYDIVFVGYPVWFHATPALINTFLESYNLEGKLIIPFCTSGESDIDETMPTFLNSSKDLAVYGQSRISSVNQIESWLEELEILKK